VSEPWRDPVAPGHVETAEERSPAETPALRIASVEDRPEVGEQIEEVVFETRSLSAFYGTFRALGDIDLRIGRNEITALIGPSGCGKSTLLRCFNRMNDLIPEARVEGEVLYHGQDLYAPEVDPIEVRQLIGMVFQKPNPFPKSVYENVAFGPRVIGMKVASMDDLVEEALQRAALWDEVKGKLKRSALSLSGGQQQRLCIARCIAVRPEVILMDEPCSALDPIATARIEDLMIELSRDFTIVIVTHNMQQARSEEHTSELQSHEVDSQSGERTGVLVEFDRTSALFTAPVDPRTEAYITGRFG
jgi:phosphate transport system ATP-binding protein